MIMEELFGGLVDFKDKEEFEDYLEEINNEDALTLIQLSLEFALHSGVYNLDETYILYKCLNKLKEKPGEVATNNEG